MNILEPFTEQARKHPGRPAIITAQGKISFAELDSQSNNLACAYRKQGLRQGDVVLVIHGVGIPLYTTLLALFRMGAVAMFPDPSTGIKSLGNACNAVQVRGLAGSFKAALLKAVLPPLRKIPLCLKYEPALSAERQILTDLPENHPALITFTSGSTGAPKGIVRSHHFLMRQHEMVTEMLKPDEGDIDLISLPVFVLSNLASGVTSIIPGGDLRKPGMIDADPVLKQIEKHRVNRILAPPALCHVLSGTGTRWPQIGKVFTGGGPVFPDLLEKLSHFAPKAEITSVYGSTEAEPIAHITLHEISTSDLDAMRSGTGLLTGKPIPDIKLKIIEGEIVVSGDHVVKGYIDPDHDKTTKIVINGEIWHKTGDAGKLDEQERLWLLGRLEARKGDLFPFCIETAARMMPGVVQAAFMHHGDIGHLVLETNRYFTPEVRRELEQHFGRLNIIYVKRIPLDKRHNSKIDYQALRKLIFKKDQNFCEG